MTRAGFTLFETGRYTPQPAGALSRLGRVGADVVARRCACREPGDRGVKARCAGFTLLETGRYTPQPAGALSRLRRVGADVVARRCACCEPGDRGVKARCAGFTLLETGRYTPQPAGALNRLRRVGADVVARRRACREPGDRGVKARCAGFTLLETLVVMLVLSLLATGYYAPQLAGELRRIQRVQADVVAHEISSLGAAAQAYTLAHAGAWPLENSDCSDAHQALTDRLPPEAFSRDTVFFRAAEKADQSPGVEGEERLAGRYYFDCGENSDGDRPLFRVSLDFGAGDAAWADYVANQLPNSSVAPDGDVRRLEIGWPKPAALPAFDAFVLKADPLFEGNLDVNGNSIFAADEVILSSGQTLASALQYAGVAAPGNRVDKPDCPAGLVPQVVTVPLEMGHAEGQPLTHFRVYATDSGSTWRIRSTVHGSGSQSLDAAARVRVGVFTLCS